MSAYKNSSSFNPDDIAQSFLRDRLSKSSSTDYTTDGFNADSYTDEQLQSLDESGGPNRFATEYEDVVTNQDEIDSLGGAADNEGGSSRYAAYDNSGDGLVSFTDSWQDGAKYQQLRGTGVLNNQGFNDQFASAKGGEDTGTVADDGGGWKLIKQDEGEKTNERKLEYKDIASQWQAAGYDVRVQDHNPDFEGGTGEIAVRVGKKQIQPITKKEKIEYSPEIQQAKERVGKYENDIKSGKTSQDIFTQSDYSPSKNSLSNADYGLNFQDVPSSLSNDNYQITSPDTEFSGSNISAEAKPPVAKQAAFSFLEQQKKKTMKQMSA